MDNYIPPGWHNLTPRIFATDHRELIAFLKDVFGAQGEETPGRPTILEIGDSMLMISGDEFRQPFPACLYVYVEDVDGTWRRAVDRGAESLESPSDMPYGDRRAMVADAWGNVWQIAGYRGDS